MTFYHIYYPLFQFIYFLVTFMDVYRIQMGFLRWGNCKNLFWRHLRILALQMMKPNLVRSLSTRWVTMSTWVCSCLIAMNDDNVYDEFIYFTLQINSSSRFTVDNKYVRLVAKDWEFCGNVEWNFWKILASVIGLVLPSRHSFMALFLIKFQFWGVFILY